jgi:hypothetical protein
MKNKALIIFLMALSPFCYSNMYPSKGYSFEYKFNGEIFPVVINSASYDEALEAAATECFNHFSNSKGAEKVKLLDDVATDLIDECTNPSRSDTAIVRS